MTHFDVPWSFYFQFEKETQKIRIQFSKHFQNKENLPNNYYVLHFDDVLAFLHKYDQKKLNYFFEHQVTETFDMIIRIKDFNKKKGYIKTHSVCYIKDDTMHCLSIDYMDVIKTKKKIDKVMTKDKVSLDIQHVDGYIFKKDLKINSLEHHLYQMIHRAYTN